LFVYGFGSDHDSKHLKMIAEAADGTFTFIEKSDMVIDAFGGTLGAEQSIFATNICLTFTSRTESDSEDSGVTIKAVESGNYRNQVHPKGATATVVFNNLMLGEERDVLVTLALSSSLSSTRIDQTLLYTSVTYTPVGSREQCSRTGGECVVTRLPPQELSNSTPQRNERVDVQVNRMLLVEATKESLNFADKGDYDMARRVVETTISEINRSSSMATNNIKTRAFVDELGSTLTNVRDRDIYQKKGGRAVLSQQAQDFGAQRQTYAREGTEGVYQNGYAKSCQSRAKTSKSGW
jgi:predicted transglutaminase-like cysteine proteinase